MAVPESINQLVLPLQVDCRLQELLCRQSNGGLSENERRELDLLIEVRETLALVRAKAQAALVSTQPTPGCFERTTRNGLPVVVVPAGTPAIDPAAVRRALQENVF